MEDNEIPINIGSKPKGIFTSRNVKINVEDPPIIIENKAAKGFLFLDNNIPNTGIRSPDTINE